MALYDFHRKNLTKAHAERKRFKKERDQLLEGIEAHRIEPLGKGSSLIALLRAGDRKLYALADQIKSKEGGDAVAARTSRKADSPSEHATRGGSGQVDGVAPETCICIEAGYGYDSRDPLKAKPCPVHSPEYFGGEG